MLFEIAPLRTPPFLVSVRNISGVNGKMMSHTPFVVSLQLPSMIRGFPAVVTPQQSPPP